MSDINYNISYINSCNVTFDQIKILSFNKTVELFNNIC